jgi:hypothetical protein
MTSKRSLAAALTALACVALTATATTAIAKAPKTKLTWTTSKPVTLLGGQQGGTVYSSDQIVWFECRGKATAVMTGWSGPGAPVGLIYSHLIETNRMMALAVRRPMSGGRFKGRALCLSGAKASAEERDSGTVTCAAKQIAIGVPIDNGPYWNEPVASVPVGARGWKTSGQGEYGRSKVVCVPAKAFRKVKRIEQTASFPAGKATASVSATCKDGRRPISWGFEVGVLPQNAWKSSQSAVSMSAPFIKASLPRGKAGWKLTFATPDGAAAKTSAPLAVHVTCAIPA